MYFVTSVASMSVSVNVRIHVFLARDLTISAFDDTTSGDEWSVVGDNSADISTGPILIFFIGNSTSDADSNPRPDPPLCILVQIRL